VRPVGDAWDDVGVDGAMSIAAAATAIIAVLVSAGFALREVRLSRNANYLPVIVDFLSTHRSPEFMKHEEEIWNHLGQHDKSLGFTNLPDPIKSYAIEVALFYQAVAYIVLDELVEWRTLVVQVHYRATRTWNAMYPHIEGERRLRGGEYTFLNSLETFISMLASLDDEKLSLRRRRTFR
jgi:hypothetical protein